jgi:hypothetical protein
MHAALGALDTAFCMTCFNAKKQQTFAAPWWRHLAIALQWTLHKPIVFKELH